MGNLCSRFSRENAPPAQSRQPQLSQKAVHQSEICTMASSGKFNLENLDQPSEDEKTAAKEALDAESDETRKVKLETVNECAEKVSISCALLENLTKPILETQKDRS